MLPVYSDALAADQIIDWDHSDPEVLQARKFGDADLGSGAVVSYAFMSQNQLVDANSDDNERPLWESEELRMVDYLQLISDIADLRFVETIHTNASPAMLQLQARNAGIGNAPPDFTPRAGDADLQNPVAVTFAAGLVTTFSQRHALHEVMHALGANHPGDYDGGNSNASYDEAHYFQDSNQYTIMSYWAASRTDANYNRAGDATLQLHDVMALQKLYGENSSAFSRDTVYGYFSNTDRAPWTVSDDNDHMFGAIWDTGGTDHIDLYMTALDADVDLREGQYSSTGGFVSNFAIAFGSVIENASTGSGNDWLSGNAVDNRLFGGAGADTLIGRNGDDHLDGGNGWDLFYGGNGTDAFYGGRGSDRVSYDYTNSALLIDLENGVARRLAGGPEETLVSIENAVGGAGADEMRGTDGVNTLEGQDNNDTLSGLDGDDFLFGNAGRDTLDGGNGANHLFGGTGNDRLMAGRESEFINGGTGRDTIDASLRNGRVIVDLLDSSLRSEVNYVSEVYNVEDIVGSDFDDTLRGDNDVNSIYGRAGDDDISGRRGSDALFGEGGADNISGGRGHDLIRGGWGNDSLFGGRGNDMIEGRDGADFLQGGRGNDTLDGNGGRDTADFSDIGQSWRIDLGQGRATRGTAEEDRLLRIENVNGSSADDTIRGDAGDNVLAGRGGNDSIHGENGNDEIFGGRGNDNLEGGRGDDLISGGLGFDRMDGQGGNDIVDYSFADDSWTIRLADGLATREDGFAETIDNFENAIGGGASDTIYGDTGANVLTGLNGSDQLNGQEGNDSLFGNNGNDALIGHEGDDWLRGGGGSDFINGARGIDAVDYGDMLVDMVIDLNAGTGIGANHTDTLRGIENVFGGGADDTIRGDDDVNELRGRGGHDLINGRGGEDSLGGGDGNDQLFGADDDDLLSGNAGSDFLFGGDGDDSLFGGNGNDRLFGGAGEDHLIGGNGADIFVFAAATDSVGATRDLILAGGNGAEAFEQGVDRISLVSIDANVHVGGDQAFVLHSQAGAGRLVLRESLTGYTVIEGYTDNDGTADFMLMIEDGTRLANTYDAGDFLL